MEVQKIRNLLSVGRHHSAILHISPLPKFSGWLRVVEAKEWGDGCAVEIAFLSAKEYDIHGLEEGPITYRFEFSSLESAIECLDEYLGPHLGWNEGHGWQLSTPDEIQTTSDENARRSGFEKVLRAIRDNTLPLPKSPEFILRNGAWIWKEVAALDGKSNE